MSDQASESGDAQAAAGNSGPYRDWTAILNLQPIVSDTPLRVGGEYFLNQRCGGVTLQVKVPPGFNPSILMLELIDGPGPGGDWIKVSGEFEAAEGQYDSVTVLDSDGEIVSKEIEVVR